MQSAKTRPGADSGSDHELFIAKFRLKLKNIGKTTRPFRYGLNQIFYDYTVEVTNRFKGLYLIDGMPEELWTKVHYTAQEAEIKTIPKKKKCKKAKWVCLSFSPLPLASLLFSAIWMVSSDSHFAFLRFLFLGMLLTPASCTMTRTPVHSSSGILSIRCNPLNLFVTSTV